MAAQVSFDLREVDAVRKILAEAALDSNDRQRLLQDIGKLVEDQTRERFISKESPDGDSWKALAEKTRAYYTRIGKNPMSLLVFDGYLRDSITREAQVDAWSVLVGSNREYAAVHQFGNKKGTIPARPYLGISSANAGEIASAVSVFLEGGFK